MKKVKLFEQYIAEAKENFNEIRELAAGFGSLDPDILKDSKKQKFASNEDLIEYLSQYMDRYDSKDFLKQAYKKFTNESVVTEKREDVGKYNTVKKVVAKLGRRPSEQELAQFITDNYYDVTEVERDENDPRADDKIADLVAFYKFDIDDWEIAWEDAQNESVVTEVVDLVHVYDEDGKMFGTGELVKTKGKKSLIRWDGSREEWVDSKLVKVVESKESDALAKAIDKAIVKIDDSMSYEDFALAVGKILKEEYGSHLFGKFMEVLHKDLGI